jgi:enamine deaminase RidA (YjgF/YER057c/UK114 family)
MERQTYSTNTVFENRIGYSRALRVGPHVYVAGTLGMGPDGGPADGGAYGQSVAALERIRGALEEVGASLSDVVRTRMFVVDILEHQEDVGRAHSEYFDGVRPVSSMIGIAGLAAPGYVVEWEIDALVNA